MVAKAILQNKAILNAKKMKNVVLEKTIEAQI